MAARERYRAYFGGQDLEIDRRVLVLNTVRMPAAVRVLGMLLVALSGSSMALPQEERANFFGDPFLQVTSGIADCPQQQGPMITQAEMRAQSHGRIERGTSCFRSGRCRLRNSYLYDQEIVPRARHRDAQALPTGTSARCHSSSI